VPENDDLFFKESFRMERPTFDMLVSRLDILRKKDSTDKRIAIALYTLGSTAEYRAVGRLFGVSPNNVCNILHEFCRVIVLDIYNT